MGHPNEIVFLKFLNIFSIFTKMREHFDTFFLADLYVEVLRFSKSASKCTLFDSTGT